MSTNHEQKSFFRECLYTALMELMNKKPIEKIGIGELCSKAGVSRMTYYRNYRSKEDILAQHLSECYERFVGALRSVDNLNLEKICFCYFSFVKEEKDFFIRLVNSRLGLIFVEELAKYMGTVMEVFLPEIKLPYYIKSYIAGGFSKMSIDWIVNGMDVPVEQMATMLTEFSIYFNSMSVTE